MVRVRVFERDGNRFLVSGFWYRDDDPDYFEVMTEAMIFSVVAGCEDKIEWLELEEQSGEVVPVKNVHYRLVGRQFEHGAVDIMLISGPLFDEAVAEARR